MPAIQKGSEENIIAVLERSDRVCQIYITNVPSLAVEIFLAAMQRPSAELTDLILFSSDETVPVDPDSFLGGYAPRLGELVLIVFHFRDYRNYFCLPVNFFTSCSRIFLIPGTFHPRQ
jgi:hypothetical protein